MRLHPTNSARCHLTAGVLVFAALMTGCETKSDSKAPAATSAAAVHTVVARGVIASLPGNKSTLQIHHEAIPGWVRPDGGKGMSEMVMPFEPKSGVSLEGFAVGDAVEFTVEITPGGAMPNWRLASIGKLPAGTELRFQATTSTKAPPTTR